MGYCVTGFIPCRTTRRSNTLDAFLDEQVFGGDAGIEIAPTAEDVAGFNALHRKLQGSTAHRRSSSEIQKVIPTSRGINECNSRGRSFGCHVGAVGTGATPIHSFYKLGQFIESGKASLPTQAKYRCSLRQGIVARPDKSIIVSSDETSSSTLTKHLRQ